MDILSSQKKCFHLFALTEAARMDRFGNSKGVPILSLYILLINISHMIPCQGKNASNWKQNMYSLYTVDFASKEQSFE